MSQLTRINFASEGLIDAAAARRLITFTGGDVGLERPAFGKHKLDPLIPKYGAAAQTGSPWFIVRDLDFDAPCAPELADRLRRGSHSGLCLRIAVREIESWLLADRSGLADFLKVPEGGINREPESLNDPKRHLVDVARRSRSRAIRIAVVPNAGAGQSQGPEYTPVIMTFVREYWSIERALRSNACPSLSSAVKRLRSLVTGVLD